MAGEGAPMAGGLGSVKVPTEDDNLHGLIEKLKSEILSQVVSELKKGGGEGKEEEILKSEIKVCDYKTQVVAGLNYFVRALINGQHWHLRIWHQQWTDTLQLSAVKGPVEEQEEIAYFQ